MAVEEAHTRVTLSLDEELQAALSIVAARDRATYSELATRAMESYLLGRLRFSPIRRAVETVLGRRIDLEARAEARKLERAAAAAKARTSSPAKRRPSRMAALLRPGAGATRVRVRGEGASGEPAKASA